MLKIISSFALLLTLSVSTQAITIVANTNVSIEGVSVEILYDANKNGGGIIARKLNCNSCSPVSLSYQNPVTVWKQGYPSSSTLSKSTIVSGDISYNPDTMSLTHINLHK